MDNITLLFGDKIYVENIGYIHQPKMQDILDVGFSNYGAYLIPHLISIEYISQEEEIPHDLKFFDYMFQKEALPSLVNSLLFFIQDKINVDIDNQRIIVGDNGFIDRTNLDELSDAILKISCREKIKPDIIPTFENDAQKDVYAKIMEGRKKKAEKEGINFETIINIVANGGKSFVPYDEIRKMTVFQIMSRYYFIMAEEGFDREFAKYLAGADFKELDLTHWINKVKIT